jgi:hypothetical protein
MPFLYVLGAALLLAAVWVLSRYVKQDRRDRCSSPGARTGSCAGC